MDYHAVRRATVVSHAHDRKGYAHYFSYQSIVQIIEFHEGIDVGGIFAHKEHHIVVVKVGHLIEYVPA